MSRRAGGLPVRIGASLALLAYGGFAFANGLDRVSQFAPALGRLVPAALQAQAARSAATLALTREQPKAALAHARAAVAADPVHPASTALLGTAYAVNGQAREAEAAFRVAARFGWREPTTQAYWYDAAMQAGDMPRAVDRADALLRTHPGFPGRNALLEPLESTPAGRAALIARMADRPNWLAYYLQPEPALDEAAFARRGVVLVELAAAGTRLGCDAVALFVDSALARGARRDAEAVWTGHCPGAQLTGGLADGGLERVGSDQASPFGWRSNLSGDVVLRPVDKGRGNRALHMRNGASVSRLVLRQAVALEPGTYRLTGRSARGRVAASLGCGQPPPVPNLVEGDLAAGGQVLRVEACPRLELGLWLRPGTSEVELDDLKLERVR